ncbi:type I DNA topoisomerase [Chloroflexota bacterium]
MSNKLVIVESPAKAKTLGRMLGKGYTIMASLGHVRDLPKSRLGVDIENSYEPKYVVPRDKNKHISELKKAVKNASAVYLATDPDREGEAIAWHLQEVTKANGAPFWRVVFHEITEEAIKNSFKEPRHVDMDMVNAQQARRIVDRLVGYKLSPLLWRKVRKGLSAGRVQSAAVRIVVDRQKEIDNFKHEEYWTLEVELAPGNKKQSFIAKFFGTPEGKSIPVVSDAEAKNIRAMLEKAKYTVKSLTEKKSLRQPAPPFITSTLQQEAWRKLRFSAKQTMALAQQLYEGLPVGGKGSEGLITYMRTDSFNVAKFALEETRQFIGEKYGSAYLPQKTRFFKRPVKGAQEAHEAIRPTRIHREPESIKKYLNNNQFRLYALVWKRMVASQMAAASFLTITLDTLAQNDESAYLLRTQSTVNTFPGFITLYSETKDGEPEEVISKPLPTLKKGDPLSFVKATDEQHFTQPPPHYNEATLIKAMEKWGIGRPSTYAPTLATIQDREYVSKTKGDLEPTEIGFTVTELLLKHFPNIVNLKFTASMETSLDNIANQSMNWVAALKEFYEPFEKTLEQAADLIEKVVLPPEYTGKNCPEGHPEVIKQGRFGKFVTCEGYPEHKYSRPFTKETGVTCPEPNCGGQLLERMSRKKKVFYGCSNYPECKFTIGQKPTPEPCPKCSGLQVYTRGGKTRCLKCSPIGKSRS